MAMVSGIQGQILEVSVVSCSKLKDTEWISRQDPYVCLEYANTRFRSRTCTDGGKYPVFQEKTVIPLIEGLREINVSVWNSNTLTFDDHIGACKVQLNKVLAGGYDDSSWPLQSRSGRFAGEVKLIMHYQHGQRTQWNVNPMANAYGGGPYSNPSAPYPPGPVGGYPPSTPYAPYPPSYPPVDSGMYPVSTYNALQAMQQPYPYPPTAYPPQPYPHSAPYDYYPPLPGHYGY